jgi:peptide chain release factor 1
VSTSTESGAGLHALLAEYADLEKRLADPAVHADAAAARSLGRRYAQIGPIVRTARELTATRGDLDTARELATEDAGFAAEADELVERVDGLERKLAELLVPRDPHDADDVVLEVKAGAGGEESALFAGDLLRMYQRYAERRGWKTEVLGGTDSDLGGFKDVTLSVKRAGHGIDSAGIDGVWSRLKYEGGVHRVQRVPVTESQGRIHTSAAGVLVYPEVEAAADVEIDDKDLRIDVFRSSGHGGQSVNTTDSAVRITHLPTGIVVSMQNEKSQIQNRAAAMRVLQSRLLIQRREEEAAKKKELAGTITASWGDQIRSYVLAPYQMVKDLRTEHEVNNPSAVFDGDLDGFLSAGIRWRKRAVADA